MLKVATIQDLDVIEFIERTCFPRQEAASKESLKARLQTYPQGFYLYIVNDEIIGYIGGLKSNQDVLVDEMYEDVSLHKDDGHYQMIFSVCILPEYQRLGYGKKMVKEYIDLKENEVYGFVLTCKDHLISFYENCGFCFKGVSSSTHGNTKWNDMVRVNERER